MKINYTLEDLKEISLSSGNNNPSIFALSDLKTMKQFGEAISPTNIFVDDDGDIIIQVAVDLLQKIRR